MENIIALVAATIVLILIPGPNVALIVANSLRHGMRIGIITSLGTTVGIALQLLIVVLGMAALIESIADALTWIRWIGVIYLLAVGLRTWSKPARICRTSRRSHGPVHSCAVSSSRSSIRRHCFLMPRSCRSLSAIRPMPAPNCYIWPASL